MLHLLIFIFWLFGEDRNIRGDIPSLDHEVAAAGDEHVVLAVVDVYHVKDNIFVLSDYEVFLYHLF